MGAVLTAMGRPPNNAARQSHEQAVIDRDIWEMAQRLSREIVADDDTPAFDVVARVGPGGSFVRERHTRRTVQSGDHHYGGSFGHCCRAGEEYTMLVRAHECYEEILARRFERGAPSDPARRSKDHGRDHARQKKVAPPEWTE